MIGFPISNLVEYFQVLNYFQQYTPSLSLKIFPATDRNVYLFLPWMCSVKILTKVFSKLVILFEFVWCYSKYVSLCKNFLKNVNFLELWKKSNSNGTGILQVRQEVDWKYLAVLISLKFLSYPSLIRYFCIQTWPRGRLTD